MIIERSETRDTWDFFFVTDEEARAIKSALLSASLPDNRTLYELRKNLSELFD